MVSQQAVCPCGLKLLLSSIVCRYEEWPAFLAQVEQARKAKQSVGNTGALITTVLKAANQLKGGRSNNAPPGYYEENQNAQ